MSKTTAIILVTFNGWSLTEACLKDLQPLLEKNPEESEEESHRFVIAIADNCSSDGTPEKIRKLFPLDKYPNVRVYPQKENLGFGAANNSAIRGLKNDGIVFDAICLLNNDTRFNADAIIKLREDLDRITFGNEMDWSGEAVQSKAVLAPTTLNVDGSRQNNFFAGLGPEGIGYIPFLTNAFRNERGAARILEGTPQKTKMEGILETNWTSAVCWMMSTELWNRVGGFDEKIFMYYEDADMALRCRKLGARFFITERSAITHLGGGSARSTLSRALQHDRSQEYVFKKHFGIRGYWLSKKFRILRSLVRIISAIPGAIIGNNANEKRSYIKHHLALFKEAVL